MDPSVNKQAAINYVKTHRIDCLIKEMLNSAINDTTESTIKSDESSQVIFNMIKYLSQFTNSIDLEKEGINLSFLEKENQTNAKKPEDYKFTPVIKEFNFPESFNLMIKRFLSNKEYNKLKSVKTVFGGHISHLINVAVKLDSKETVGIYTTDFDCYNKMSVVINPAMEFLHSFDKEKSLFNYYNPNSNFYEECKDKMLYDYNYQNNDIIKSIRIKLSRNLKGFPYLPHALEHTTLCIKEKIVNYLKEQYPKGSLIEKDNEEFAFYKSYYFDKEINFISAGCKNI